MVHILLAKLMLRMRFVGILLLAMGFAGCTDWYYEFADTDYTKINEHELRGKYPINGRTLEGNIVFPKVKKKGSFTPEEVVAIQLDSSLAEIESFKGSILKNDSADYRIPYHAYKYPYVKIRVKGKWKNENSEAVPLTLETICDISNVLRPNVNLMTHLEVPLVETFVAEDYPFGAAKNMAAQTFAEIFGFVFEKQPTETYDRTRNEMGPFFQMFLLSGSDSAFVESIEEFRLDMADGIYDENAPLVRFADYVLENWLRVDTFMKKMNVHKPDTGEISWTFAESLVRHAYGLSACTDSSAEYLQIKEKNSKFNGDSVVCDVRENGEFLHRLLDSLERRFGACTAIDTSDGVSMDDIVSDGDSAFYYCDHKNYGNETWFTAPMYLVLEKYLGKCNNDLLESRETPGVISYAPQRQKFKDSIYVCSYNTNRWYNDGADTLSFFLGECGADSLWKLKTLNDEEFVCTFDSWTPANDTLRFLSEQRPCERDKDWYRSFEYDSNYYICAEMKMNDKNVYTFKDTTQAYAESLGKCQCVDEYCYRINCPLKEF